MIYKLALQKAQHLIVAGAILISFPTQTGFIKNFLSKITNMHIVLKLGKRPKRPAHKLPTSETTKIDGGKLYTVTYPLEALYGLVRIHDQWSKHPKIYGEPEDCKNVELCIKRHNNKENKNVIFTALLDAQIVELEDRAEKDDPYYKKYNKIWLPFCDGGSQFDRTVLRGQNNRLELEVRYPGIYTLITPHDTDIEAVLQCGAIQYASETPTQLHVEASDVNQWGDSGSSTQHGEKWHYFWGSKSSPITDLKTNGRVAVYCHEQDTFTWFKYHNVSTH